MRRKQASKEIRPKIYQLLLLISSHNSELTSTPKTPSAQSNLNYQHLNFSGYCHIKSVVDKQLELLFLTSYCRVNITSPAVTTCPWRVFKPQDRAEKWWVNQLSSLPFKPNVRARPHAQLPLIRLSASLISCLFNVCQCEGTEDSNFNVKTRHIHFIPFPFPSVQAPVLGNTISHQNSCGGGGGDWTWSSRVPLKVLSDTHPHTQMMVLCFLLQQAAALGPWPLR